MAEPLAGVVNVFRDAAQILHRDGSQRMKHAVTMVAFNRTPEQLALTKEAVNSILAQDIGELDILLVDNGSTDGTREYFESLKRLPGPHRIRVGVSDVNLSPNVVANRCLKDWFGPLWSVEKVLCVANDVILPPNMYRLMSQWPRGMVTASQTSDKNFPIFETAKAVSENTPFSVLMLRRWVYDAAMAKDGYFFDERYFTYCSDCDLALRIASCGIRGIQLDTPFWHFNSATWKLAPEAERQQMLLQADKDREKFIEKWGFRVDSLEYGQIAQDPNFRGVR
jgi:GT2 family glycosyltransferase